jgi:nitronate monooxygenase
MANIGYQQIRENHYEEPALVTVGDDLNTVAQFLAPGRTSYTAAEVIDSLLSLAGDAAPPEPAKPDSTPAPLLATTA